MGEEVLVGLPGQWAEDYREMADHYTTKIGGIPDWPIEDLGIRPELLQCSLCRSKLCLVAQVFAPVSVAKFNIAERAIYVFSCQKPECGSSPESWKVLRVQKCHSDTQTGDNGDQLGQLIEESVPVKEAGCSDKLSSRNFPEEHIDENGDSDDDIDLDDLAKALEQVTTLASHSKKQHETKRNNAATKGSVMKQRVEDPTVPVLPCFYVYCERERPGEEGTGASTASHSVSLKQLKDAASDQEDNWEVENYEYDKALGADRTFLKFKKRLGAYPEQCFRYSYGGSPLLATTKLEGPGTCTHCGSIRNYELQLMPPLLYFLTEARGGSSDYSPDGWTWMTLIIYTCSKSCFPSSSGAKPGSCLWGVAEEEIIIQED